MGVCTRGQTPLIAGLYHREDRKGDHCAWNSHHHPPRLVAPRPRHVLHARRLHPHPPGGSDRRRADAGHSGPKSAPGVIAPERPITSLTRGHRGHPRRAPGPSRRTDRGRDRRCNGRGPEHHLLTDEDEPDGHDCFVVWSVFEAIANRSTSRAPLPTASATSSRTACPLAVTPSTTSATRVVTSR